jgi:hypothetical protein
MPWMLMSASFIPSLYDSISMPAHQFLDSAQFDRVETVIIRQHRRVEPRLADASFTLH